MWPSLVKSAPAAAAVVVNTAAGAAATGGGGGVADVIATKIDFLDASRPGFAGPRFFCTREGGKRRDGTNRTDVTDATGSGVRTHPGKWDVSLQYEGRKSSPLPGLLPHCVA